MQRVFIPAGPFQNILHNIAQWKVIGLRKLFDMELYSLTYQGFAKQVTQLEREGLIASFRGKDKNKYLYLTPRGAKITNQRETFDLTEDTLTHDLICSNVVFELLKYENFVSGNVLHESSSKLISPDAVIHALKGEKDYAFAVEVELNQKSKDRIREKFVKYANTLTYAHALYVTNKLSLIKSYMSVLSQMKSEVRNKIVFLLDENLSTTQFEYKKARCWFKDDERNFESIFGK
jgi:hypothetical protein